MIETERLRRLAKLLEKHAKNPYFDPYYDLSPEDKEFLKELSDKEDRAMKDERDTQGYIDWLNNHSK